MIDPDVRGMISAIGIQKGKLSVPDKAMKVTLAEATTVR